MVNIEAGQMGLIESSDAGSWSDDEGYGPTMPIDPTDQFWATTVKDYILGNVSEIDLTGEALLDHKPIYTGARIAMRDEAYMQDGCHARLGKVMRTLSKHEKESESLTGPPSETPVTIRDKIRALGNCAGMDPEIFFPGKGEPTTEAKRACMRCAVQFECLDANLGEKLGIWGGTTARGRREIRRDRNKATVEVESVQPS